jgi:hypothetical protein
MNTRQKIITSLSLIALVVLLMFGPFRDAQSGPIQIGRDGKKETFDLTDPVKRAEFREIFADLEHVQVCFDKADYGVAMMEQRNEGITEAEHLEEVRANYENTKLEPQGAVPWSVYVDFQRMVHDVHRRQGVGLNLGYRYNDPNVMWDREFRWCALK